MTHLLQIYHYLNQAMRNDPLLCLAQTVCWLDPLWQDDEYDVDDPMSAALSVTRRAFPELYVEAIEKLRQGASDAAVEQIICEGISKTGIPLDTIEHLAFGIPLPVYGATLDDPEFYANHPDALPVLACFGISPDPNPYQIDVPDYAYTAAEIIATDLISRPEEPYQQVGWLLRWLFSSTGNSICDWDYEIMGEIEPMTWEQEDIDFARSIIEEADEVMSEVFAGLEWLTSQPAVLQALHDNIQRIYKAIEHKKGKNNESPCNQLIWTCFNNINDDIS